MGKKRRKFIDPKRDVLHTFKVVARSQQDPLAADEEAPQAVLQPSQMVDNKKEQQKYGIYFDDDYDYLQHLKGVQDGINWDNEETEVYMIRKEDPQARGKELMGSKLVLPSSAFESFVEEPVGLLNKAAPVTGPQPQLDPDIVAALDDEDSQLFSPDDENALPDNFVSLLNSDNPITSFDDEGEWEDELDEDIWGDENGDDADDEDEDEMPALEEGMEGIHFIPDLMRHRKPKVIDEDEERDFSSDFNDSDDEDSESRDTLGRLGGPALTFNSEENKSHFTNYSLTSSVLKRTQLMSTLDDRFEEMFMKEYDEEYVGALDGEDIAGFVAENSPLFKQAVERSLKQLKRDDAIDDQEWIINWIKDMQRRKEDLGEKEELEEVAVEEEPGEKWDCETILSTYSNIYNHPKLIEDKPKKRITVDPRTGMPVEHRGGLTKRALAQLDRDAEGGKQDLDTTTLITSMSTISIRPPGETAEERRARKKALKELRRERRVEKKLNRSAFREEKKKQEKSLINARHNKSIPVV